MDLFIFLSKIKEKHLNLNTYRNTTSWQNGKQKNWQTIGEHTSGKQEYFAAIMNTKGVNIKLPSGRPALRWNCRHQAQH